MTNIQTTVPMAVWDAKKFHWKLFLQGEFESLKGCPNWLYETIRQIKTSGQVQEDTIYIVAAHRYQYAMKFTGTNIQIYSKQLK
jgi:hypothetical protein